MCQAQEITKPEMSEKGKRQGSCTVCDRYSKLEELDEARKGRGHEGMVFLAEYLCLLIICDSTANTNREECGEVESGLRKGFCSVRVSLFDELHPVSIYKQWRMIHVLKKRKFYKQGTK